MKLNDEAKAVLSIAGVTQAEWARRWFGETTWRGDVCGCPDERCRGYHHDKSEPCGCVRSLAREYSNNSSETTK
ncbi:hypothetical protein SAMN04489751_0769 [Brevibacterium sandarakinum]|uniref:Uncharacterized protein n=1 Tax=Brevibacterium sandarakinum TaxID=629680 RepID=A0A1H1MUT2_BRESA|nr:hypothetical protein SAMN04489751_0769 [Brevibacterium sandarakinum]